MNSRSYLNVAFCTSGNTSIALQSVYSNLFDSQEINDSECNQNIKTSFDT